MGRATFLFARLRANIYPFEIVAFASLVATVTFLRLHHLRIDWQTFEYTVPPLVPVMGKYFAIGVGLYLVYLLLRRQRVTPYIRRVLSLSWLTLTGRLWLAIIVFTYCYLWLKVCAPLVNHRLWDAAFWRLDTILHFGFSPSLFLLGLTEGTGLIGLLDQWYKLWLPSVSLSIAFFMSLPGARVRRRFVLSCVLIWVLGAWTYVSLPALGPIYAFHPHWENALPDLPEASAAQELLWGNYEKVIAGRTGNLKQFNPTLGIAAMPSLHVGVHWLLMLWIRRYARPFFVPAVIGTFLTFLGSIATGWHYAIDGYVGIGLGQLSFWLAHRTERRPQARFALAPLATTSESTGQ